MSNAFHLQIISPAAIVLDTYATLVEIPGVEGDFGVLAGHAPTFSMIRPGAINVALADGYRRRFFVAAGYADVTPTGATVLSDHIEDLADISSTDAADAVTAARDALAKAKTPQEEAAAQKLLTAAEALMRAVAA